MLGSNQNGSENGPTAVWARSPGPSGCEGEERRGFLLGLRRSRAARVAWSTVRKSAPSSGWNGRSEAKKRTPSCSKTTMPAVMSPTSMTWAEAMTKVSGRRLAPASNSIRMGVGRGGGELPYARQQSRTATARGAVETDHVGVERAIIRHSDYGAAGA